MSARARLRRLEHKERTQLTARALDAVCEAYFGPNTGWWWHEPHVVALACRHGLPANPFGPTARAYLTPYLQADCLEDGALVLVHQDGGRTVHPYETCEDVVILLYRFYGEKVH